MNDILSRNYASPEVLVSTDWLSENLNKPNIRIIESNEDQLLYKAGHIPGSVEVDWIKDLNNQLIRDYLDKPHFEELMSRIGVSPETTVVVYGDKNNWWACYTFWIFKLFNHADVRILDGGSLKWKKEGRELKKEVPKFAASNYHAPERDDLKIRALRDQVLVQVKKELPLIDVRSPEEFSGERLHMPDYPNEGALRGGHIPGAKNIPWARAINTEDGGFKGARELRAIYEKEKGLSPTDEIIAYCRIGERSSHTWFVLSYLLGYQNVKNYDGSWTEWGNLVGAPIAKSV